MSGAVSGAVSRVRRPGIAPAVAHHHHLLLLADDVESDEVASLVLSHVAGSQWTALPTPQLPGVLDLLPRHQRGSTHGAGDLPLALTERATLTGPWRVDLRTRHALALPAWVTQAWVVDVEPDRSGPAPALPHGYGPLLDAFGAHHPDGVERQVLDVVHACARRLAGILRTTTGVLLEPDPDSAVDLTVHAPVWLTPEAMGHVLGPVLPGVTVLDGAVPTAELDGYHAFWRPSERDDEPGVLVEAEGAEVLPAPLANAAWTGQGVVTYRLRWLAEGAEREPTTRGALRRRASVREAIERAAAALRAVVGGEVLDEDGFLVDLA
ncbi:MAG TPA: hypothetical protein DHV14_00180 [Micrococcales bacterium]|nr:hypothetical protein [Micrococcales bacterium]